MGFKLYNGCPNDELAEHWRQQDVARKYIVDAGYRVTWFPMEERYFMCVASTYEYSGKPFYSIPEAACWLENHLKETAPCTT